MNMALCMLKCGSLREVAEALLSGETNIYFHDSTRGRVNPVAAQSWNNVARALEAGSTRVQRLHLLFTSIPPECMINLARAVGSSTSLAVLDLRGVNLFEADAFALATAVATSKALTELDLGQCGITDNMVLALAHAASTSTSLSILCLQHNHITDEGASALAHLLRSSTALTQLDLSYNHITGKGASALAEAVVMETSTPLAMVSLRGNQASNAAALSFATAAAARPSLMLIDLWENPDVSIINLVHMEVDMFKRRNQKGVLNLSHHQLADGVVASVFPTICTIRAPTKVDLSNNRISDNGAMELAGALVRGAAHIRILKRSTPFFGTQLYRRLTPDSLGMCVPKLHQAVATSKEIPMNGSVQRNSLASTR